MAVTIRISGEREIVVEGDTISVGRDPACSVALPGDERIEPLHAVIRRVAGRWVVEARGNGLIQVGDGRPTQMGWLGPGDLIRLTASGPDLIFDPHFLAPVGASVMPTATPPLVVGTAPAAQPPAYSSGPQQIDRAVPTHLASATGGSTPAAKLPIWWALGGGGLIAAGTLLALFVLWVTGGFQPRVANRPDAASTGPAETAGPDSGNPSAQPSTATDSRGQPSSNPAAGREQEAALYLVLASAGDDGPTYQLGTAWAVSKQQLITSGAIAAGLEAVADVAPRARVVSPESKRSFVIRAKRIHPQYQAAMAEAARAQNEAEGLRLDLEQLKDPARIDALTEKLIAAEERRFEALERQVDCDLAVLEIEGESAHALPVGGAGGTALKAGNKIMLHGVPFRQEDYLADPDSVVPSVAVAGSVFVAPKGNDRSPRRWVLRCSKDFGTENWSGAPVLDSRGQVMGVYSRPTPPPPDREDTPAVMTHDIRDRNLG
jgi:hypothetical protein